MADMKISIVTPTVRKGGVDILTKCLQKQTFPHSEFEWIISSPKPFDVWTQDARLPCHVILIKEKPLPKPEWHYGLNHAWNRMFRECKGELIVSIVDLTWVAPDCLERFWNHYIINPKACISGIGHQYDQVIDLKPEHLIWQDPRARTDQGSFYEVMPTEIELCCTSFPRQAVLDVGGIDEEWDKYAALSEKEFMLRCQKAGYQLFLDQTQEYRAIHHGRLTKEWDKRYFAGTEYYDWCVKEILDGRRLKLDYV